MKRSPSSSGLPGGPPGMRRAVVVENLRARPARAGIAHRPEIVRGGDADDLPLGQAGDLGPQPGRLVVIGVDGDEQLVLRQAEFLGDQVPGQLDRPLLEVIAEREIAEHLEKGVMPRGVADVFQVVVLAAGAHAFLRGGGALIRALLDAGEDVLELHHPGIGEQQGRVVARHQRARRHDGVPGGGEIFEKRGADVVGGLHGPILLGFPPFHARGAAISYCSSAAPAGFSRQWRRTWITARSSA